MDRRGDHESVIAGGRYGTGVKGCKGPARHWLQSGLNVNAVSAWLGPAARP